MQCDYSFFIELSIAQLFKFTRIMQLLKHLISKGQVAG